MTTIISDAGVQFAGGNIVDIRSAVPTTGSYTQGDVVIEKSTNSELAGWKRLTTGSDHVLGTDWLYFGAMGVGQTWQNVTGSRTSGTTYYNTTPKPIFIVIIGLGGGSGVDILCNGVKVGFLNTSSYASSASFVCPPGGSYVWNSAGGTKTLWTEFR